MDENVVDPVPTKHLAYSLLGTVQLQPKKHAELANDCTTSADCHDDIE